MSFGDSFDSIISPLTNAQFSPVNYFAFILFDALFLNLTLLSTNRLTTLATPVVESIRKKVLSS